MQPETPPLERRGRIIIADDHELARLGLRTMLEPEPDLEVIGEAATGREAVALSSQLQPDLVLMDIRMPDMDGLMATRAIKEELPRTSILIVTLSEDPDYLLEALRVGAAGFVLKDSSAEELIRAVRSVARGDSYLDPAVTSRVLTTYRKAAEAPRGTDIAELTTRELDVLTLIGKGFSNTEIADELCISGVTVKSHIGRIFGKLGLRDRAAAIVYAYDNGIVAPR